MLASAVADITSTRGLEALAQVLWIDLVLAGDNAVVIGSLASRLSPGERRRVVFFGTLAALVLRIAFALVARRLVRLIGMLLAGGLLLLWVGWRFWRSLRTPEPEGGHAPPKPGALWRTALSLAFADVSMSLDNVLGVVGAARDHPAVLVLGLILSVALMGLAANVIAGVIERQRWIAYGGLLVILYIAARMIYDGIVDPDAGVLRLIS